MQNFIFLIGLECSFIQKYIKIQSVLNEALKINNFLTMTLYHAYSSLFKISMPISSTIFAEICPFDKMLKVSAILRSYDGSIW